MPCCTQIDGRDSKVVFLFNVMDRSISLVQCQSSGDRFYGLIVLRRRYREESLTPSAFCVRASTVPLGRSLPCRGRRQKTKVSGDGLQLGQKFLRGIEALELYWDCVVIPSSSRVEVLFALYSSFTSPSCAVWIPCGNSTSKGSFLVTAPPETRRCPRAVGAPRVSFDFKEIVC